METKTEVPCRCDLVARQARADEDAVVKMKRKPKRLWHNPSCPIAQLVELHLVENAYAKALEDVPLPGMEGYHAGYLAIFTSKIKRLRKQLGRYADGE